MYILIYLSKSIKFKKYSSILTGLAVSANIAGAADGRDFVNWYTSVSIRVAISIYIYIVISSKIALKDWVKKTFELNGVIQTISTMNPCNALFNYAVHGIIGKESSKIFWSLQ